jgi:decaprenylphospho-beta-D-erythro-pentofuranosid-2-ulose 2-reductase
MSPLDAFGRPSTVLLLGARSGIGLAITSRLVRDGTRTVVLAGRDGGDGPELAGSDVTVERVHFDATDTEGHAAFFDDVFERHRVDVVILAVGVLHPQEQAEGDPNLAVEMIEVNVTGSASALLHAARHLRRRGAGRIVVLSSVAGQAVRRSNYVYGATKAAIDFLARGLTQSLEGTDVGVTIIRPGFVPTAMTAGMDPAPLSASPDQVADAVADSLASGRSPVWVPGALRWVMAVVRRLPPAIVGRLDRR